MSRLTPGFLYNKEGEKVLFREDDSYKIALKSGDWFDSPQAAEMARRKLKDTKLQAKKDK